MMTKQILTAAVILLGTSSALFAAPREIMAMNKIWQAKVAESAELPSETGWAVFRGGRDLTGIDYRNVNPKPPKPLKEYSSAWYRQKLTIPASWKGSTVRFHVPIQYSDMIVYVNGKKAGEILKPAGALEIGPFLKYGGENTILLFQTKNFTGISRKSDPYYARTPWEFGFQETPFLVKTGKVFFDDVFANPSFRKKQLCLDTEIMADSPASVTVSAEILDRDGKTVKRSTKTLSVSEGVTPLSLVIPWTDPHLWEINAPYLYTCRIRITDRTGKLLDEYPAFRFGFREIWRDGKEFYMNGHIQRIRPVYGFGINEHGVSFMRLMGYTATDLANKHYVFSSIDEKLLNRLDEVGMVCFAGMPSINYMRDKMRKDPAVVKEYDRYAKLMIRRYRNHPSIFAWCVGMNTNCPSWNMDPDKLGQIAGIASQDQNINAACDIGRKYSPSTVFYSHADGSNGDISTNNLYLNFTPLQEREEWMSKWSKKGSFPWLAAEFGEPYVACYWQKKNFLFTEYMAIYYGEDAYAKEPVESQKEILPFSLGNKNNHADGIVGLDTKFPLFWDFKRQMVWRTNRAWRTFGINGGMLYFNLREAYGNPPGRGNPYARYGRIHEEVTSKPEWANQAFDIYQLGNKDFLGYIGGWPEHTDKTHAFRSGETIDKQLVFVWDGPGRKTFTAQWKVVSGKSVIASGEHSETLSTGDVRLRKVSFRAPSVGGKTLLKMTVDYSENGKPLFTDSFDLRIYPAARRVSIPVTGDVAVLDPSGKAQAILNCYGIRFRAIKTTDELGKADYLIFGRNALDNAALGFTPKEIAGGLKVLIMAQSPDTWNSLGFNAIDSMSRQVYLRDRSNPAFRGLSDDELANWRGAPDYGKPFGPIMSHDTQRGPRWTRTHTVAGLMLRIPERAGFVPLIDGEFDLNYAALMRWSCGKGSILYCTLDLEDRVPSDPLAEKTARAVLTDFFSHQSNASGEVYADGKDAELLLKKSGSDFSGLKAETRPSGNLLVVGGDSSIPWERIKSFAEQGGSVLVVANPRLVKAAGLKTVSRELYRAKPDYRGLFATVGQSLLRWRDVVNASLIQPAKGVELFAEGLFALLPIGRGRVLFGQMDPELFNRRYAKDELRRTATALSSEHLLQLYSRLMTSLGARPGKKVAMRLAYQAGTQAFAPLKFFYVLGPFRCEKDDSKLMLNTVFPGEEMAIAGDNNPNPRFKLPQGGETDWRPTITSDENGYVNLNKLFPDVSCSVSYVICYFKRENAGPAILKFGVDWRAKIWCNGTPVFYTEVGSFGYKYETKVNLKKGENYISMKIGSGSYGNCFWASLSRETPKNGIRRRSIRELDDVKFYENSIYGYDPYTFHYW